ncbi:putative dopamine beta-monooxygenase [Hibiscus syriacus]|uniref:Dopamine beta-monooxygenase n=1 Tax=Hibiscus syriacus TaxID=106335 RepID=A0A6A2WLJ2_HIBSY|nr:putative dopamine beta-monooxygenase [Hibiscus syriacus]
MVVLILSNSATSEQESNENYSADDDHNNVTMDSSEYSSAEGHRWLLHRKRSRRVTCNKFPIICHAKGSPGPICCKKKCVNVLKDWQNCGKCGKKCKYNEICCKGQYVNPSFNAKHCGGCNNRCGNGEFCVLVTHSINAIFAGIAPVVASAAMPFIESNLDALSPAANLGELALPLACAAVVVVRRQKDAFVVAASGGGAVLDVANLLVFVAVIGGSGVSNSLLEETTYPFETTRLWQYGWFGLWECG